LTQFLILHETLQQYSSLHETAFTFSRYLKELGLQQLLLFFSKQHTFCYAG